MIWKSITCVNVFVLLIRLVASDDCKKTGPCSCLDSKGLTIDLTPLAASGKAKFADLGGPSGYWYYSWNPCTPFSEGTGNCNSVAVCQSDTSTSFYSLGSQDSADFVVDPSKGLQLTYSGVSEGLTRYAYITLVCDKSQEGTLSVEGESSPGSAQFFFTLSSKYACRGGSHVTVTISISAGTVICLIFFSLFFVYLVGGFAIQTFVRKASGREMVPNVALWSALPGLIRDGVLFVIRCGKSTTYDKI